MTMDTMRTIICSKRTSNHSERKEERNEPGRRKEFRQKAFAEKYGSSRKLYSREEWLKRRPPEQSSGNHGGTDEH